MSGGAMRRLVHWSPALAAMGVIAWLSHQPSWPEPMRAVPDWALHASAYAGLTALCYWGASDGLRCTGAAVLALAAAVAIGYGAIDEIHQSFIPGRDASLRDWLADAVGCVAMVGLLARVRPFGGARKGMGQSRPGRA